MNNTDTIATGCVIWFNKTKGYGFITNLDNNEKVFVHRSSIYTKNNCYKVLHSGEYVDFNTIDGKQGKKVEKVTGIKGGKLLCESIYENKKRSWIRI